MIPTGLDTVSAQGCYSSFGGGASRAVDALIQAALECRPMLVERVSVEDDIRAETTRVPSGRRQMHEPRRRNESLPLLGNA